MLLDNHLLHHKTSAIYKVPQMYCKVLCFEIETAVHISRTSRGDSLDMK